MKQQVVENKKYCPYKENSVQTKLMFPLEFKIFEGVKFASLKSGACSYCYSEHFIRSIG